MAIRKFWLWAKHRLFASRSGWEDETQLGYYTKYCLFFVATAENFSNHRIRLRNVTLAFCGSYNCNNMPAWSKQSKKLRLVVRPRKKGIYWRAEEPSSHLNNIPWNRLASQRATSIGIARKVALYSVVEPRWPFSTVKAIVIFHVRCGGVLVSVQLWLSKLREQYLGFYNTQHAFFKRYSFLFFPIYLSVKSKLQHSPA